MFHIDNENPNKRKRNDDKIREFTEEIKDTIEENEESEMPEKTPEE